MDDTTQEIFEAWALVELFGRNRLAGRITEQTIGGCHFIRVDVPEVDGVQGYTRLFTQGAIYGITITTEDIARCMAANLRARPISAYDIVARTPMLQNAIDDRDDGPGLPF